MTNKLNFAASRLVNPPSASPVLTEEQVWKGLEMKVRTPQDFVPAIVSCEIISDAGNKVLRSVVFRGGEAAREDIEQYEGIVYFDSAGMGTRITNILSYNEDNQMVLTFSFAGGIPGHAQPSADAARPSVKEMNEAVGPAVEHTIARIRELVKDGTIA